MLDLLSGSAQEIQHGLHGLPRTPPHPALPRPMGPAAGGSGLTTRKVFTAGAGRRVQAGMFWYRIRSGLPAYQCGVERGSEEAAAGWVQPFF